MTFNSFAGIRIVENPLLLVGPFEDWSKVRSKSRAVRRRKRGHKQNISYYHLPDPKTYMVNGTAYVHPDMAKKLRRALEAEGKT